MMKNFFKISFIAVLIFTVSCKGKAQEMTKESLKNSTPEQRAKFITDTMRTVLNLSEDAYASVYNINLDIARKNETIMKSDDGKISKFKQLKANQDSRDSALQKVLTKEQFDLYQQKVNEIISAMKQKYKDRQNN
jgi:hypothetical protein